jgi:DNA gyrase inhibitor GyrI
MTIENISNSRLAFVRRTGKYGQENKETMEKLKEWAKSKQLFNKSAIYIWHCTRQFRNNTIGK